MRTIDGRGIFRALIILEGTVKIVVGIWAEVEIVVPLAKVEIIPLSGLIVPPFNRALSQDQMVLKGVILILTLMAPGVKVIEMDAIHATVDGQIEVAARGHLLAVLAVPGTQEEEEVELIIWVHIIHQGVVLCPIIWIHLFRLCMA
jgi:hypothetical protein